MSGTVLLSSLLAIAESQRSALADENLEEFDRLATLRESLQAELSTTDWNDGPMARETGLNILALDQVNVDTIKRMLEETSRARSSLSRGARALHGYGGPTQAQRQTMALYDRDA